MTPPVTVLFLCTGNSARSIMAEAAMNHPSIGGGKFRAYSAGSHPRGTVHPLALELLQDQRIPTAGLRSKSWDEFAGPGAPRVDVVITVCDQVAAEQCPFWAGQPVTAHWGLPDPAALQGTDDAKRRAFRNTFFTLRRRMERLASLPLDTLTGVALRQEIDRIGRDSGLRAGSAD